MEDQPPVSRRRFVRSVLGTSALAGVSGCLGLSPEDTQDNATPTARAESGTNTDSQSSGVPVDRGTATFDNPKTPDREILYPFETYLPAEMRTKPKATGHSFSLCRPSSLAGREEMAPVMEFIEDGWSATPPGTRLSEFDRIVSGPGVTGFEGRVQKSRAVQQELEDGASRLGSRYGYTLLETASGVIGITNGIYIELNRGDTTTESLRKQLKAIIDRQIASKEPPQSEFFNNIAEKQSLGLLSTGFFDPEVNGRPSPRSDFSALADRFDPVEFVGQEVDTNGVKTRATTLLSVSTDLEAYHEFVVSRLADHNHLGYFSYTQPTILKIGGLLYINEEGEPADLLR